VVETERINLTIEDKSREPRIKKLGAKLEEKLTLNFYLRLEMAAQGRAIFDPTEILNITEDIDSKGIHVHPVYPLH
jgi:hypothetical protein